MNVRKNIIIEQRTWDYMAGKALAEKTSVSDLIELAVKKEYAIDNIYDQRRKAVDNVILMRDNYRQSGKLDYKAMAHEDHKY